MCLVVWGSVGSRRDRSHQAWVCCRSGARAVCWWSDARHLSPLPPAHDRGISALTTRWRETARVPPPRKLGLRHVWAAPKLLACATPGSGRHPVLERMAPSLGVRAPDAPAVAGSMRGGPGICSTASAEPVSSITFHAKHLRRRRIYYQLGVDVRLKGRQRALAQWRLVGQASSDDPVVQAYTSSCSPSAAGRCPGVAGGIGLDASGIPASPSRSFRHPVDCVVSQVSMTFHVKHGEAHPDRRPVVRRELSGASEAPVRGSGPCRLLGHHGVLVLPSRRDELPSQFAP